MSEKLKKFKWGYILLFILLAVIGICFVSFRESLKVLAIIIGVFMILYGIVYFVLTIADKRRGAAFAFKIVVAACALICGVVTAIFHEGAINVIVSLFSLFMIIDGSFKLQTTALSKRYNLVSWWVMLIPSVLVILGAYVTLEFKEKMGIEFLSVVLGIVFIIDAISNLLSAFYTSGYERGQYHEFEEEKKQKDEQERLEEERQLKAASEREEKIAAAQRKKQEKRERKKKKAEDAKALESPVADEVDVRSLDTEERAEIHEEAKPDTDTE